MKRKKASIIFLFVSLFVLSCFALSYNAKATSDINYTFIDNVLYESDDIELSDSFNLQNESIATELYNGTYSFEDDEIGEFPLEWVSYGGATTNEAFVSSDYKEHNKVLTLENDTDIGLEQIIYPSDGLNVVEFWVLKESGLSGVVIEFYNNIAINLTFMMVIDYNNNGLIREYEGSDVWETITDKYADDVWIHVKISFNDASHLLDVYVNGVLEMEDNPYVENVDIGLIRVRFGWGTITSKCHFDAFGYSWEPIYDFTDVPVGTSETDIDLIDSITGNDISYSGVIVAFEDGYKKVFEINASGENAKNCMYYHDFSSVRTTDIVEFAVKFIDNGLGSYYFAILDASNVLVQLQYDNANNRLYAFHAATQTFVVVSANTWTYVKIKFDTDTDRQWVWVNDSSLISNLAFVNNDVSDGLIKCRWQTYGAATNDDLQTFVDDYSEFWHFGYNVGDNLFPIFNTTSNLVVAKDEFAYDVNGEFYEAGVKDACGWEGNDIDYTYLIEDNEQIYDKKYKINNTGTTANKFIRKYYDVNDGVYNFTLNINYLKMLNLDSSYWWTIASTLLSTTAVIELIYMNPATIGLRYLDDIDAETYTLIGTITYDYDIERELTLFIGDLCYLTYKDTTKYYEVIFPKLEPEEEGLYEVAFAGGLDDTDDIQIIHIDSIGVFVNGTSVNDDFASSSLDLNSATWYSKTYNLIDIDALGFFGFTVYSSTDSESLKGFYNYTNSETWNVYGFFLYMSDPSLSFISNESFAIESIKIYGVKMTDETFTFIPDFYYGSVNIDESYFYVDSSNRLQFNLICNDNYTEWIELRFFLVFIPTENTSIQFKSNIDGVSQGYVHLAHWGFATTDIYFPTFLKTTTVYLPQGHYIRDLSIIISDKDITYYDVCSGYITDLKFLYSPGGIIPGIFEFDITILISVLIPLIIILAPTLAMSIKFGKKGILPMFILMCLICTITNLIPIWVFFIIALSSGALLFMSHNRGGE